MTKKHSWYVRSVFLDNIFNSGGDKNQCRFSCSLNAFNSTVVKLVCTEISINQISFAIIPRRKIYWSYFQNCTLSPFGSIEYKFS